MTQSTCQPTTKTELQVKPHCAHRATAQSPALSSCLGFGSSQGPQHPRRPCSPPPPQPRGLCVPGWRSVRREGPMPHPDAAAQQTPGSRPGVVQTGGRQPPNAATASPVSGHRVTRVGPWLLPSPPCMSSALSEFLPGPTLRFPPVFPTKIHLQVACAHPSCLACSRLGFSCWPQEMGPFQPWAVDPTTTSTEAPLQSPSLP